MCWELGTEVHQLRRNIDVVISVLIGLVGVGDREDLANGDGGGAEREAVDKVGYGGKGGLNQPRCGDADRRMNEVGRGGGLRKVPDDGRGRLQWLDDVGRGG